LRDRYINPFTDFGFKRLFGEEANKDILMDFLNELLRDIEGEIKGISFMKNEHIGSLDRDRRAIFDIYCENEKGEKFIVEMQKAKQNFFKDRSVFYSTFPIREQAAKGDWNYNLKSVYTIGILDFIFEADEEEKDKFLYHVKLSDIDTNKVFYDKLTFIYLEMPKFGKPIEECETHFDKWLFLLKNLPKLHKIPEKFQEKIFKKLFGEAEIANFNRDELLTYEEDLKIYRDMKGVLDTAKEEGREEERKVQEEKRKRDKTEIAKKMKSKGFDSKTISELTGFSIGEIDTL